MTNTSLKYDGGYSTLETDVKNISNETNYLKSFDIIVKDKILANFEDKVLKRDMDIMFGEL